MCLPEDFEDTPFNLGPKKDLDGLMNLILLSLIVGSKLKLEEQLQEFSLSQIPNE